MKVISQSASASREVQGAPAATDVRRYLPIDIAYLGLNRLITFDNLNGYLPDFGIRSRCTFAMKV
jgi:hypothetical protein